MEAGGGEEEEAATMNYGQYGLRLSLYSLSLI